MYRILFIFPKVGCHLQLKILWLTYGYLAYNNDTSISTLDASGIACPAILLDSFLYHIRAVAKPCSRQVFLVLRFVYRSAVVPSAVLSACSSWKYGINCAGLVLLICCFPVPGALANVNTDRCLHFFIKRLKLINLIQV